MLYAVPNCKNFAEHEKLLEVILLYSCKQNRVIKVKKICLCDFMAILQLLYVHVQNVSFHSKTAKAKNLGGRKGG